ncbi:cation diffusion facilitator family transporter [Adhaeribacter pallidiroseus]|uniref:Putative zinc transporter protein n=1 Tax=Adhaeribacter pallidiroseus TaxID=2072847 RepID=A0A369QJS0_9BACT|nr:cation diffusion facilitator family transporter [Adhaeribacter pallidiroseus]RDC64974.1 putative zinc transporter protein [Adhaeribacter pallidiroseus]
MHSHDHSHGAHHHHEVPTNLTRAFVIGIALNVVFVMLEAVTGFWLHSLALLTDAGHNLSDVASLVLALLATRLATKKATDDYTYGFKKSTTLVSLFNAVLLLVAVGAIGWEAFQRLGQPQEVGGQYIAYVSGIGILVNAGTALLFLRDKDKDLNVKGAYLHMAADALVSLGVVIAGIAIYFTNWFWIDSVISLVIIAVILWSTWSLLTESLKLSLDGVPSGVNLPAIRQLLINFPGVKNVHDLHIWAMSTTENALTAHLVVQENTSDTLLAHIREELAHHHQINHATIQIEKVNQPVCEQTCEHAH